MYYDLHLRLFRKTPMTIISLTLITCNLTKLLKKNIVLNGLNIYVNIILQYILYILKK